MAWLRIVGGPQDGHTFKVEEAPATIGRGPANQIQLRDEKTSRRHASIRWVGKTHQVVDLGSENGVYVNGERVFGQQLLWTGDQISLGTTRIVYESGPDVAYDVDYARQFKDARSDVVRGETKGVSLADVQAMMSDDPAPSVQAEAPAASAGPVMPASASARSIPLAVEPDRSRGTIPLAEEPGGAPPSFGRSAPAQAAAPAAGAPAAARAHLREQIVAALRRKLAQGIDVLAMTDLIVAGLARGVTPDRVAIMLKLGRQAVLKPVKTWQRPDVPAGAPMPALLREVVLETVQGRHPRTVASGDVLQLAGSVPRQTTFAALCVPIVARGTVVGVLYVDNALRPGFDFNIEDLRFALELASALAPVVP